MFFRTPRFIRQFLRRNTHPMAADHAWSMKKKLSVLYTFLAWNSAGIVLYMIFTGRKNWPKYYQATAPEDEYKRPAVYHAELLGIREAKVLKISGFSIHDEGTITINTDEKKNFTRKEIDEHADYRKRAAAIQAAYREAAAAASQNSSFDEGTSEIESQSSSS